MAAHNLVERALDIIGYLADHPDGRSVTEIADDLRIPPSAAHRLLISLGSKGVVEQHQRTRDYILSLKIPALGARYLSGLSFMDACRPVMDTLASRTRELVRLAVVSGQDLIWIAKAQGSKSSLRLDPLEGRSAIAHVTAAGKAWLAAMTDEAIAKRFSAASRQKAPAFGPNAHTELAKLMADLELCRRRGFATTYEEAEPGVAAVGSVIRSGAAADAAVVGTISVAGPTARIPRKELDAMGPLVTKAAGELSAVWPATQHVRDDVLAVSTRKRGTERG